MHKSRLVFLSGSLGMLIFGISIITLGSVAPSLQQKFDLGELESGTLFSILPFGILLGSLLFGPFADRYGYKAILVISSISMFLGFQGIAYAPSLLMLRLSIFVFGLGGGVINGSANASVADISAENKGANISLIGVFYAVGALGMPFLLGIMQQRFSFSTIVSGVGYFTLVVGGVFLLARFPAPKQSQGIPVGKMAGLLKETVLMMIAFFLFCQSAFEGIINNWTTIFLKDMLEIPTSQALYALSLYVMGMAAMRLLVGSFLRRVAPEKILILSFVLLLIGVLTVHWTNGYSAAVVGLMIMGAGLASGFPVMLGYVGDLYASLSGTAFSIVFTIALLGNTLMNLLMGVIADAYGVQHLTSLSIALLVSMMILSFNIVKRIRQS